MEDGSFRAICVFLVRMFGLLLFWVWLFDGCLLDRGLFKRGLLFYLFMLLVLFIGWILDYFGFLLTTFRILFFFYLIFLLLEFFFLFLLLSFLLFLATFTYNLTKNFIIIYKHITDCFAIGNVIIFLFDPDSSNEGLSTVLIIPLLFLDLTIGLLEMWQPLGYPLTFECSTQNVNTCCRQYF